MKCVSMYGLSNFTFTFIVHYIFVSVGLPNYMCMCTCFTSCPCSEISKTGAPRFGRAIVVVVIVEVEVGGEGGGEGGGVAVVSSFSFLLLLLHVFCWW